MFLRRISPRGQGRRQQYWVLLESYRTARGSRHRIVAYLGKLSAKEISGWEKIAARLDGKVPQAAGLFDVPAEDDSCPRFATVDLKNIHLSNLREFGQVYLAWVLWRTLGLDQMLAGVMPRGLEEVSWNMTAAILCIARFCHPSSELYIERHFYPKSGLQELLDVAPSQVQTDRLYRGLDRLLEQKKPIEQHLRLGSPTHTLSTRSYAAWISTYQWRKIYDHEFLYAGPLFTHQISHIWIDFLGIQDDYMRGKGIDYFENSRRATYVQRQYAIENPAQFDGYGSNCWGITATDGPGPANRTIKGRQREFFGYDARGVPDGPDDGSIAPWVVVASLPFAPEIVLPAIQNFEKLKLRENNPYGFKATFNPTFADRSDPSQPWVSPFHFGLNQGPIVLMIENYRTGLLWRLTRQCPHLVAGLQRAGFAGGWLGAEKP